MSITAVTASTFASEGDGGSEQRKPTAKTEGAERLRQLGQAQEANKSLSSVSGAAGGALTAEALAEMSEEEFQEVYERHAGPPRSAPRCRARAWWEHPRTDALRRRHENEGFERIGVVVDALVRELRTFRQPPVARPIAIRWINSGLSKWCTTMARSWRVPDGAKPIVSRALIRISDVRRGGSAGGMEHDFRNSAT